MYFVTKCSGTCPPWVASKYPQLEYNCYSQKTQQSLIFLFDCDQWNSLNGTIEWEHLSSHMKKSGLDRFYGRNIMEVVREPALPFHSPFLIPEPQQGYSANKIFHQKHSMGVSLPTVVLVRIKCLDRIIRKSFMQIFKAQLFCWHKTKLMRQRTNS